MEFLWSFRTTTTDWVIQKRIEEFRAVDVTSHGSELSEKSAKVRKSPMAVNRVAISKLHNRQSKSPRSQVEFKSPKAVNQLTISNLHNRQSKLTGSLVDYNGSPVNSSSKSRLEG